jgi:sugar diacid utilization regulator
VVRLFDVNLRRLLLHFAADDFRRVLPAWVKDFLAADDHARGALIATLRAYADVDMNVLKAAEVLGVHANTVYARMQRVHDLTGLEPRSFNALNDLLIVCDGERPAAGV